MVDLYKEQKSFNVQVTDYKYVDYFHNKRTGFTMNRLLWTNIQGIPSYISKDNSMIIIVSGSGLTRTGKSTLARQIGYAAAWCIAGGKQDEDDNIIKYPKEEVKVNTYFDTVKLTNDISQSVKDYQVYVLDESDEACGTRTSLSKKNKEFRDLIIRSACKKMVLIIVLPDFFMLNQHWACVNSDCLINVFPVQTRRGFFNFYNRAAKERLYFWGKKKVGAERYSAKTSWPTFHGEFVNVFPGNENETKEQYEKNKQTSLLDLTRTTRRKTTIQRDHIIKKVLELTGLSYDELSKEIDVPYDTIHGAVARENVRNKELLEGGDPIGDEKRTDTDGESTN